MLACARAVHAVRPSLPLPLGHTRTHTCAAPPPSMHARCSFPAQVGLVHSTRFGEDDAKTLKQLNFQTGDFLSVAIT